MRMHLKGWFAIALLLAGTVQASDYKLQTLENAHGLFHAATNATLYAEAAKQYEYLVEEDGIQNGHLFYTLGNCWFMAGDPGRAILNYRRAKLFLPRNTDLRENLASALELRSDLIPEKDAHPLVTKLLGWHVKTTTAQRGGLFVCCWLLFWGFWFWTRKSFKREIRITAIVTGVLSVILLGSLLAEAISTHRAQAGVILAKEVLARKGNGTMYAPAFQEPLHSGTEFQRLEVRKTWWYIRLADGQTCWIPATAAETIAR